MESKTWTADIVLTETPEKTDAKVQLEDLLR